MSFSRSRGNALLGMLSLAGVLAVLLVGVETFGTPSQPLSQTAQASSAVGASASMSGSSGSQASPTTQISTTNSSTTVAQQCQQAIALRREQIQDSKTIPEGQGVRDNCIAVIKTSDATYRNTGGLKCVGKSAQIMINNDGSMSFKWQANESVAPGKCKTVACQAGTPIPVVGYSSTARCVAAEFSNISNGALLTALRGPDAFDTTRSAGGAIGNPSVLTPNAPLNESQQSIFNAAFGRDPSSQPGIPLSAGGAMGSPAYEQIQQWAQYNPDSQAHTAQQEITNLCSESPQLCQQGTLEPPKSDCDKYGCYSYPTPEQRPALEQQGFVCDTAAGGQGLACFRPSNDPSAPQGPCPPGTKGIFPSCVPDSGTPGPGPGPGPTPGPTIPGPTPGPTGNPGGNNQGGQMGGLSSFLQGLMKGFTQSAQQPQQPQQPAQQCSTDPAAYQQQQQQYQQQLQQYNYQLQQYQYQMQLQQYQQQYYGGLSSSLPPPQPQQPTPCSPSTTQQCTNQQPQPAAALCTQGYWQPIYQGSCVTNWQCVNLPGSTSTPPTASLSCQPELADVGQTLAISYSCSSGTASSSSFTITDPKAGSASTTVKAPPQGANTATYSFACTSGQYTRGAQCSVQINQSSIILVANPRTVQAASTTVIGWVTSGMRSCVISSPDQADFTERNKNNSSPAGTAESSPIQMTTQFALRCETLAGGTKEATTTVSLSN